MRGIFKRRIKTSLKINLRDNEQQFKTLLKTLNKRKIGNLLAKFDGNYVDVCNHLLSSNNIENKWDMKEKKTYNDILIKEIYKIMLK